MAEAHIRIDEGIKRGPRIKQKPHRRSPKADLGSWVIPNGLNPDEVLERYLTESTTSQIAAQYGLSRKALTKWLRETKPKEWKQAQIIRALALKEDGEEGLMLAPDALSLARARELVKASQFDLTSLDPDYQPKQQVTLEVNHHVLVEHALADSAMNLFKSMRGVAELPNAAVLPEITVQDPVDNK